METKKAIYLCCNKSGKGYRSNIKTAKKMKPLINLSICISLCALIGCSFEANCLDTKGKQRQFIEAVFKQNQKATKAMAVKANKAARAKRKKAEQFAERGIFFKDFGSDFAAKNSPKTPKF